MVLFLSAIRVILLGIRAVQVSLSLPWHTVLLPELSFAKGSVHRSGKCLQGTLAEDRRGS